MIVMNRRFSDVRISEEDIAPTIEGGTGEGGNNLPMIIDALPFDTTQVTSPLNYSVPKWGDACHPLAANQHPPAVAVREEESMNEKEPCSWDGTQTAPTLTARNAGGGQRMPDKENFNAVLEPKTYGLDRASYNQGKNAQYDFAVEEEKIGAQVARGPGAVATSVVRRLMPAECEALQGYPLNWTLIGKQEEVEVKDYVTEWIPGKDCKYSSIDEALSALAESGELEDADDLDEDAEENCGGDGFDPKKYGFVAKRKLVGTHTELAYFYTDRNGKKKRCADSSRYKAIGNSIAVGFANNQSGFWMWLMKRISAQYERSATLGSLFDGIGGFPLAWETYNGRGSAVWASEIEPFCIEVTRRRFPDPDDIPED